MGYGVLGKEISEIFDNLFHGIWKNVMSLYFLLYRIFFRLHMAIAFAGWVWPRGFVDS